MRGNPGTGAARELHGMNIPWKACFVSPLLQQQMQAFQLPAVLGSGCHNINSRRLLAAVPQDVGQARQILLHPVEAARK